MGLNFDSPISFGSTAYEKAKRRVSTRGTTFSPLQAFKTRRIRRALSQSQSPSQNAPQVTAPARPASGTIPGKDSGLFTLPTHVREQIYQFVISPSNARNRTLHVVLKHTLEPNKPKIAYRICRAHGGLPCVSVGCRAYLNADNGAYRGSFDSVINILLVSRNIYDKVSHYLYSHYTFDFDQPIVFQHFIRMIASKHKNIIRSLLFEPGPHPSPMRQHHLFNETDVALWQETWQALDSLQGLRELRVWFTWLPRSSRGTCNIPQPPLSLKAKEGLVMDLRMPAWYAASEGPQPQEEEEAMALPIR